jgi:GT2 family glycosyltransferase
LNDGGFLVSIYITDDGCTDGTVQAIASEFSNKRVKVLKGTGSLYWAGGMRTSWMEALKSEFDGYLLLNDDVNIFKDLFIELQLAIEYCYAKFKKNGIIVGSTKDEHTNKLSYGGSVYTNKFMGLYKMLIPSDYYQECELGNGNIMFVHGEVVDKIGILSKVYTHGVADYDYTYTAKKFDIPVILLPGFSGFCTDDSENLNEMLANTTSIRERYLFLKSPTRLALTDNLYFQRKFFPLRFYLVLVIAIFKVFFPRFYTSLNAIRR